MDLEARVNQYYDELNENDKEVISYIVTNKRLVTDMTITTLAEASLTSKSSILRLTKKLGYSGYSEFKYSLQNQLRENKQLNEVLKFSEMQMDDIEDTIKLFKQIDLIPLLEKIYTSKRIFCYGTGWGQRIVLTDFIRSLIPLNKFPSLLASLSELEMTTKFMAEDDLLIVLSLSGDIKEAEKAMRELVFRNIPILSITELRNNEFASLATYNLYYSVKSIQYNKESLTSLLPLHLTTDLLFRNYVEYIMEQDQEH